jgi:hypothetical protein
MGGECGLYWGEEKCIVFWWGKLKERSLLEDPGVDGSILLKWILNKQDGSVWTEFI